ncbi:hypothetical protein WME85_11755 [Sorangium sp. So ce1153]
MEGSDLEMGSSASSMDSTHTVDRFSLFATCCGWMPKRRSLLE